MMKRRCGSVVIALAAFFCLFTVAPAADPTPAASGFSPFWVAPFHSTTLWSGNGPSAPAFGPAPLGLQLRVDTPQNGSRLFVWNPVTQGWAWVDANAVGPVGAPSDGELQALTSFQPWWAETFTPTWGWSAETSDAAQWGAIDMWRFLQVVMPEYNGRVYVRDPLTNSYAWVDSGVIGPAGEPPAAYIGPPPPDQEEISLPGRVTADTDRYRRPGLDDYFALDRLFQNDPLNVEAITTGLDGNPWYRIGSGEYLPASKVRIPDLPDRTFPGRWIDANLTEPVIVTAYEDDQVVYSALGIKGRDAFQTPLGVHYIRRRVDNETMDSETVGIPHDSKDGYLLKNVLFTQYFTGDGASLHYNYWRVDWGHAGSHGCIGLNYGDALFMWEFATVGTPVYIHT
ncbi:MAG TPA: L,D-transpeptidase [Chloroflexota bacterium]